MTEATRIGSVSRVERRADRTVYSRETEGGGKLSACVIYPEGWLAFSYMPNQSVMYIAEGDVGGAGDVEYLGRMFRMGCERLDDVPDGELASGSDSIIDVIDRLSYDFVLGMRKQENPIVPKELWGHGSSVR